MENTILEELARGTAAASPPRFESAPVLMGVDVASMKAMLDAIINQVKELQIQGSIKPTVIYDLDETHSLRQPIHVVLLESEEFVHASWPELHLYAEADTPNDAITALKQEIVTLYDDLASTPEPELGILPKRWLKTLKSVIQANA